MYIYLIVIVWNSNVYHNNLNILALPKKKLFHRFVKKFFHRFAKYLKENIIFKKEIYLKGL